jgi:hypothetical protein
MQGRLAIGASQFCAPLRRPTLLIIVPAIATRPPNCAGLLPPPEQAQTARPYRLPSTRKTNTLLITQQGTWAPIAVGKGTNRRRGRLPPRFEPPKTPPLRCWFRAPNETSPARRTSLSEHGRPRTDTDEHGHQPPTPDPQPPTHPHRANRKPPVNLAVTGTQFAVRVTRFTVPGSRYASGKQLWLTQAAVAAYSSAPFVPRLRRFCTHPGSWISLVA